MGRIPTHPTRRYLVDTDSGGGWEFYCPHCSYRARYTLATRKLVVLNNGDARFHHTTLPQMFLKCSTEEPGPILSSEAIAVDDFGLPMYLVQQIEAILGRSEV